jgi:hypothetical protein
VESICHDEKNARKRWTRIRTRQEHLPSVEFLFPILASARLNADEGRARIASGLQAVRKALDQADEKSRLELMFLEAALIDASGQKRDAQVRYYRLLQSNVDVWIKFLTSTQLRLNQSAH